MIFSRDKKPTEPGWYKCQLRTFNKDEAIAMVTPDSSGRLCAVIHKGNVKILDYVDDMIAAWGDRIEIPTIETKQPEGAEG